VVEAGLHGRRIAVTGALGMLGSHTVDRLLAAGAQVSALDRRPRPGEGQAPPPGVRFVEADVRDRAALRELLDGADTVVHLAAVLSELAARDPWLGMEVNVTGTRTLLDVAGEVGVGKVVYGSSVAVYGQPETDVELDEDSPLTRPSAYGSAKLAAESYVRAWANRDHRSAHVLRLGTLYSERAHTGGFHLRELSLVARALAEGERALTVRGDPAEVLDLLHAVDAADAIARCCGGDGITTLNIVSGAPVTWREVVLVLADAAGGASEIVWDSGIRNWATGRRFSAHRAVQELGAIARVTLPEGMARLADAAEFLVAGSSAEPGTQVDGGRAVGQA
jgi:UDP-glucose 4-epimerase